MMADICNIALSSVVIFFQCLFNIVKLREHTCIQNMWILKNKIYTDQGKVDIAQDISQKFTKV